MAGEIFGLLQWARRIGCQRRTANRLQALAKQPVRIARRERLRAIAHGEIDALPIEIEHAIVGGDENVDVRMPLPEPRQPRQQPQGGKRDPGRNRQRRRRSLAANLGHRMGQLIEHCLRRQLQHLTRFGQSKRAMPALEQGHAELFFECLHLAR